MKDGEKRSKNRQQTCFMCRRWNANTINTTWRCKDCGMPLCKLSRSDNNIGREYDCHVEHKMSHIPELGCGRMERTSFIMPAHLKMYTTTRAQTEKKKAKNDKHAASMREKRGGGSNKQKKGKRNSNKASKATEKSPVSSPVRKKTRRGA